MAANKTQRRHVCLQTSEMCVRFGVVFVWPVTLCSLGGTNISEWHIHSLKKEAVCSFETFAVTYPIALYLRPKFSVEGSTCR